MRWIVAIGAVAGLVACDQAPDALNDLQMAELKAGEPDMSQFCLEKIRDGGTNAMPLETDHCYPMAPARRWQGLWANDFEGQEFCPSPARERPIGNDAAPVWLTFDDDNSPPGITKGIGGLYRVDFIGRRTLRSGNYGHFGMFSHEVIVDQLLSIEQVKPPRSE